MITSYKAATKASQIAALLLVSGFAPLLVGSVFSQPSSETKAERERAIQLYQKGETKSALTLLSSVVKEDKNDALAWHYLGLALMRLNEIKKARRAFENATRISPDMAPALTGYAYTLLLTDKLVEAKRAARRALELDARDAQAHYIIGLARLREGDYTEAELEANRAIELRPTFSPAFLLKSQALLANYAEQVEQLSQAGNLKDRKTVFRVDQKLLKGAAENLEIYLKQGPHPDSQTWQDQLEAMRTYALPSGEVFKSSEVDTKAKVLSKPEPGYTEEARQAGVSGKAILRAVFSSRGTVEQILVLRGLPYGLTEVTVRAARRIKFVPATKDGKPVSTFIQLEYNFNLF